MKISEAERSGKLVVEATDIAFSYQGSPLVKDFSTTIMRGDRIGLIGPIPGVVIGAVLLLADDTKEGTDGKQQLKLVFRALGSLG